jgi:type I restriction enzyme M protein
MSEAEAQPTFFSDPHFVSLTLTNFLSYKSATIEFSDLIALVGPNASGKSNFVSAIKLLREIGSHGLPVAVARRGGFDQLRHRSNGRPNNPSLRIAFRLNEVSDAESYYEIAFSSVAGGTYRVKSESAVVFSRGERYYFRSDGKTVTSNEIDSRTQEKFTTAVAPGHSAVTGAQSFAGFLVYQALSRLQTVEINPQVLRDFQEPTSLGSFEPDGSNVVSVYDSFNTVRRRKVLEYMNAIVPGLTKVEVSSLAGQQTLTFGQLTPNGVREFTARQMSDGTLRAFSILVALFQPARPSLIVFEEPEIAIHLGALRALVDILKSESAETQMVITTHSADIVDQIDVEAVRVVWTDGDRSRISPVSAETRDVVREQLLTVGELMRSHALDPEDQ